MHSKPRLVRPLERDRLEQLSDDELMVLVAADHRAPFEQLVKRHHPLAFGYATRFLGDRALGRDVAQEVFLTLWQQRRRYRPEGRLRSYLLSIAFNRCQAVARRRRTATKKLPEVAARAAAQVADTVQREPLDELLEAEKRAHLRRQLLRLNERTRRAIILRFFFGLTYEEISDATGQRVGTVKSQVSRGMRQLCALLAEEHRS